MTVEEITAVKVQFKQLRTATSRMKRNERPHYTLQEKDTTDSIWTMKIQARKQSNNTTSSKYINRIYK